MRGLCVAGIQLLVEHVRNTKGDAGVAAMLAETQLGKWRATALHYAADAAAEQHAQPDAAAEEEEDAWVYQWDDNKTGKKYWVNELTGEGKWLVPSPVKQRR